MAGRAELGRIGGVRTELIDKHVAVAVCIVVASDPAATLNWSGEGRGEEWSGD
jgi:hypothetical protein